MAVCAHVEVNAGCYSSGAIHLAFRDNLSLAWSVPSGSKSGWLVKEAQEPTPPALGSQAYIPHAQLFTRVLGTERKPSYLPGKHYQLNCRPSPETVGQL